MYDPIEGRWMEEDPILFKGGDLNLYRYVGNDPTNLVDPSGLLEKRPIKDKDGKKDVGDWSIFQDTREIGGQMRPGVRIYLLGNEETIKDTAKKAGGDHFNVYQIITKDPEPPILKKTGKKLELPYVDPPVGGYGEKGQAWSDDLPWYYNEGPGFDKGKEPEGYNPALDIEVTKQGTKDKFQWDDLPLMSSKVEEGTVSFKTWLVLLDAEGKLVRFEGGFSWDLVKKKGVPQVIENVKWLPKEEMAPCIVDFNTWNEQSGFPQPKQ
jgi:uncharacterized protein RhaS with RHS repeats